MLGIFISCIFFYNRLLDRDQVGDEEATLDDEDEDGFLKAFKVDCVIILHIFCSKCLFNFDLFTLVCSELRDALDFSTVIYHFIETNVYGLRDTYKSIKSKLDLARTGLTYVH